MTFVNLNSNIVKTDTNLSHTNRNRNESKLSEHNNNEERKNETYLCSLRNDMSSAGPFGRGEEKVSEFMRIDKKKTRGKP